ncbi:hypothetical protein H8959_011237, partial [Pygathrix nigripes]
PSPDNSRRELSKKPVLPTVLRVTARGFLVPFAWGGLGSNLPLREPLGEPALAAGPCDWQVELEQVEDLCMHSL